MSTSIITRLKDFSEKKRLAEPSGKIIYIEKDQKSINCPNHFVVYQGIKRPRKQLIVFNSVDEVICDCGIIYSKKG